MVGYHVVCDSDTVYYGADSTSMMAYDDGSAARQVRDRWLLFTRGRGWTEGCPLGWTVGVPMRRSLRLVPGLRTARRRPRRVRWFTLKQLRRKGIIQ